MHRQIAGRLTGPVTKWLVLAFWIVMIVVFGGLAGKLSSVQDNQASSWLPASAESTQALDALKAVRSPNDIPTTLVFYRPSGLTAADGTQIRRIVGEVQQLPGTLQTTLPANTVTVNVPPFVTSPDHKVATATVTFNFGKNGWNKLPDTAKKIRKLAEIPGVTFHLAGPGGQAADAAEAFSGLDGKLLGFTILVVVIILLITYRSPLLWLLPVLSAGTALAVAQGVIYLLAKHEGLTVNGQSQGILTVLVFGAGTDYALLLIARYREELHRHENRHEAMAFALHRAAPAIVASGLTVILGMLCLTVAEMNSTSGLGPVAAIGIVVGLLVMITLLPAFLVIFGRWIFWPVRPKFDSAEPTSTGFWARVGKRIAIRPRTVWTVTALILAVCCLGLVKLNAHGLSTADQYTKEFDSIKGTKILAAHKLSDDASPIQVVAKGAQAAQVKAAMEQVPGVDQVSTIPFGTKALVSTQLNVDPTSSEAFATVAKVRTAVHAVPGADAMVGGATAIQADIESASSHDNEVVIPLVLLVVMLVLMVLLRALAAPLLLILTVVLSFGAALGISSLIFRYVFDFAGTDTSFPLFVFVFLVALGIDYNIFLMTRVREETVTRGTREGSLVALGATGGVITSAGVVLAATFSVLGTMPLVAFAEIGIAVALGVLLDTLVVRSVLVTALNLDLGSVIWWPSRLDRRAGNPDDVVRAEVIQSPE